MIVVEALSHSHAVTAIWHYAKCQMPERRTALNGELPIHLLDTDIGARQVEDILGRVAHGIVA